MNHLFDKIYCINLKKRPDRWEKSLKEFEKLGIVDDVIKFDAIDIQPGIIGCTKSHYEIVKLAKKDGCKNVLIFEDDLECVMGDVNDIISKCMDQLNKYDKEYDMLYFGGNITEEKSLFSRVDDNLSKMSMCKTTHAYVLNSSMFGLIINSFDNIDWNDNWNWSQQNQHRFNIDKWYINNIHSRGKTYGVYPCLFNQRNNFSDLLNRNSDFVFNEKWDRVLK
jgi:glycosyl transferase family 25